MQKSIMLGVVILHALFSGSVAKAVTNSIAPGQTFNGSIQAAGQIDYCSFSGTAGDVVTILMGTPIRASSFAPRMELRALDGSLVASNAGYPSVLLQSVRLTNTDTYLILSRDDSGLYTNNYGLTLVKNPGPNTASPDGGAIGHGETKTGTLDLGALDVFTFAATNGDVVSIQMTATLSASGFAGRLDLHAPDGTVLSSVAGVSQAKLLNQCLPQTGTYMIVVRDLTGIYDSSYSLSLNFAPTPSVPPNDPEPHLLVLRCQNDIFVRWLTNTTGLRLESAPSLPGLNQWQQVTNAVSVILNQNSVTLNAAGPRRFFRLISP